MSPASNGTAILQRDACRRRVARARGFTVIELLIVMVVLSILLALAFPSYRNYVIRASRQQAQTLLLQLAGLQEKIFLNSNSYTSSVNGAYTGASTGGLGLTNGRTPDGKYNITVSATSTTFTITADPSGIDTPQKTDGAITIDDAGTRLWAGKPW